MTPAKSQRSAAQLRREVSLVTAEGISTTRHSTSVKTPLILASASPRRQEILRWAGIPFEAQPIEDDPEPPPGLSPVEYCCWVAREKASTVAASFPGRVVVGADTVVAMGPEIMGKPADPTVAATMLRRLSGRQHTVYTGLAVMAGAPAQAAEIAHEASLVTFHHLTEVEIASYVATGDPLDKAGAYGIQSAGGTFVAEVFGSYLNVVGLPLALLRRLLARIGRGAVGD